MNGLRMVWVSWVKNCEASRRMCRKFPSLQAYILPQRQGAVFGKVKSLAKVPSRLERNLLTNY